MRPLLCELHAHTDWSDGELTLPQLVDTYGRAAFDVLCVTDHVHPPGDPWSHLGVRPAAVPAYLAEIERESERARSCYGLLLLPGFELTDNQPKPDRAAHALTIGIRSSLPLTSGIAPAMAAARDSGAAVIAAHPSGPEGVDQRATRRFWRELRSFRDLIHRWELINRHTAYPWVAQARLPAIATGDFHRPEHLAGWKTLLPCEKDEDAIVAFLRSDARAHLTVYEPAAHPLAA
jgi:hypothetical protein